LPMSLENDAAVWFDLLLIFLTISPLLRTTRFFVL
jgi:hypothetical protein